MTACIYLQYTVILKLHLLFLCERCAKVTIIVNIITEHIQYTCRDNKTTPNSTLLSHLAPLSRILWLTRSHISFRHGSRNMTKSPTLWNGLNTPQITVMSSMYQIRQGHGWNRDPTLHTKTQRMHNTHIDIQTLWLSARISDELWMQNLTCLLMSASVNWYSQ